MSQAQKDPLGSPKDPKRTSAASDPAVVPIREPDQLEATLPPTPLRDLLAADGASVCVLSDDASLLATVREAAGEHYPVFPAGSWQALREAVAAQRCGIALLDADSVPGVLGDRLTELASLRPAVVTLLASNRDSADDLLNLLSERKIHRLLIKPPTVGITRLLLESSVSRYFELRQQPVADPAPSSAGKAGFAGWPSRILAGGLVIGVLAAIVPTSLSNRQDTPDVSVATPTAEQGVADPSTQEIVVPLAETVEALPVDQLPAAMSELLADTAPVDATVPVLPVGQPPAEPPKADQLGSMAGAARPEETVTAAAPDLADVQEAPAGLTKRQALAPGASRLEFVSAQLGRERARVASIEEAAAAEAAALAATPSESTSLIGLARARRDRAQLTAPGGDSALDHDRRAVAVDAEAAEVEAPAADLGAAVLTAAEIALAEGRFAEAEALFMEAQELGVADAELVGLELSLLYARESLARAAQDDLLDEALGRIAEGRLFEPASGSALTALLDVQRQNPDHPGLEAAFAELEAALQAAADGALADAEWNRAEAAIEALSQSGAPPSALEGLRAELAYGRAQEAFLAEAAPASELEVVQFEPPVYPDRAQARGIEGWVDLEFVVDAQGRPYDIAVTASEPPGQFEPAAIEAAAASVYTPFELDGRVYERRVELRMRFALE